MNNLYQSTRDDSIQITASNAILKGLSDDGGLFVLKDINKLKLNVENLMSLDYIDMAIKIVHLFLSDFSETEISECVKKAYTDKFENSEITPVVNLSKGNILELFHGPTSAFKDIALLLLPHLTSLSLTKNNTKEDILILTATSGDTGKAALEGFKNVDKTKILTFFPENGVSMVQQLQMVTTDAKNTVATSIVGNFDDAQTAVKTLFMDKEFNDILAERNIKLSSANSINIGRLIPQTVYYFYAYSSLIKKGKIKFGDKVNFIVPTGNFGDILAGYYAKLLGLPINKFVCASNSNNVLFDFIKTGTYNKNRPLNKTISPSMDILVSSNLERFLYYISGCDSSYVSSLMNDLTTKGSYTVTNNILNKIQEIFEVGYATDEETKEIIKKVYEQEHYLLDTHTAVAYKVFLDYNDISCENVILSTASPYKFSSSVYSALDVVNTDDEFKIMEQLHQKTKMPIPKNLKELASKEIIHKDNINKQTIKEYVLHKVEEM